MEGKKNEAAMRSIGSGGRIKFDKKVAGAQVARTKLHIENLDSGPDLKIIAMRPSGVS